MSWYSLFTHTWMSILLLLLVKGITCSGDLTNPISRCTGDNVCLKYSVDMKTVSNDTVYWYYKASDQCVLLGSHCVLPNANSTFKTLEACNRLCKNEVIDEHGSHNCGEGGTGCEQDLPPKSNTTTRSSLSPVITIGCAIGGIALVAIVIAGAIMARRRKKIQKRRYVEDMLHMWSSNSSSDDSYDSYEDNPEDNNLFDRLERKW